MGGVFVLGCMGTSEEASEVRGFGGMPMTGPTAGYESF